MTNTVRGVIHGRTIELADDPGIEDGRGIEVTIRAVADEAAQVEAILRTAGSMADDPEFDAIMAKIQHERHADPSDDRAGWASCSTRTSARPTCDKRRGWHPGSSSTWAG